VTVSTAREPFVVASLTAPDVLAWRRAALWALLAAKLVAGWGVGWDIQWHILIGRDSFWIAPHVMTYAGVTAAVLISLGVLAYETLLFRRGRLSSAGVLTLAGVTGTRGFHLAALGMLVTVAAAPIDDLWHRLFGIDVTLWSPPHLLGLLGSQINSIACLLIACEVWPRGSRTRLVTLIATGALTLAGFQIAVDPSIRIAYIHGGIFFFTFAILGALLFTPVHVAVAWLTDHRWAPLAIAAGLVVIQVAGAGVTRAGFAILQPVSQIDEVIANDTTSPIAVAHIIARKNGTRPGQGALPLRVLPLLPAALLLAVDTRRRWVAASVLFGLSLFAIYGYVIGHRPAFQDALPSVMDGAVALPLAVAAALAGGAAGRAFARLVHRLQGHEG
jgi:hypothetical protein